VLEPNAIGVRPPAGPDRAAQARGCGHTDGILARDEPAVAVLLGLVAVARGMRRRSGGLAGLRSALARPELAGRHLLALLHIALRHELTVGELARALGVARTTASLLVTELAGARVVTRSDDPGDRRRTVVSVAPDHRTDVSKAVEDRLAPLRRAVRRLGPEATASLLHALAVLTEELAAGPAPDTHHCGHGPAGATDQRVAPRPPSSAGDGQRR
jgi:DNA-binding MarR family transcriptional regulator